MGSYPGCGNKREPAFLPNFQRRVRFRGYANRFLRNYRNMREIDMEKVVIFGNGRWAETVYICLTHDSPYEVAAFTVDPQYIQASKLFGLDVIPFTEVEAAFPPSAYKMLLPLSYQRMNRLREEKYLQAKKKGYQFISYVSSRCAIWPEVTLGENCYIADHVVIYPFARIGNNVAIAAGALIGHHSIIRDHCFIAPGAVMLGGVTVEPYCFIGANSTIKEGVTLARECLLGAGVTIIQDTEAGGVYLSSSPERFPKSSDELRTWLSWSPR